MAISERQMLDALRPTPFVDSTELAGILGEPHATIHRILSSLLTDGIVGRVSHGTVHLPSPRGDLNRPRRLAVTRGLQSPQPYLEDGAVYRPLRPTSNGNRLSITGSPSILSLVFVNWELLGTLLRMRTDSPTDDKQRVEGKSL